MTELWKRLRQARKAAGLTQQDIATATGVSRGAVTQWEAVHPDTRTSPSLEQLATIAQITNTSVAYLAGEDPVERPAASDSLAEMLSTVRRAKNFWAAVEYEVVSSRPELEPCFHWPGLLGKRVDFADSKNLVLHESTAQDLDPFARLSYLLGVEKLLHRHMRKHALVFLPDGQADPGYASLATALGVSVKAVTEPRQAAAYLLSL